MVEIKGRVCARIKALPEDPSSMRRAFEGDLSTYGNIDLGGDVCEAGCFDHDIAVNGSHRPLLWQHMASEPIGSFNVVSTDGALRIKGEIDLNTPYGPAAYSLLSHKDIDGLSIGYNATDYSYDRDGVRHLLKMELMEGSIVTFPMNPKARAEAKSRRHARMSRFSKCAFLTKMTDEERAQALAELDEMDRERDEQEVTKDPAQEPEQAPEQSPDAEPAEEGADKAPAEQAPPQDPPAAQPTNTGTTEQSESEVAKVFREVGQALIELRTLLEASQ